MKLSRPRNLSSSLRLSASDSPMISPETRMYKNTGNTRRIQINLNFFTCRTLSHCVFAATYLTSLNKPHLESVGSIYPQMHSQQKSGDYSELFLKSYRRIRRRTFRPLSPWSCTRRSLYRQFHEPRKTFDHSN